MNKDITTAWDSFFNDFPFQQVMKNNFAKGYPVSIPKVMSVFYLHFKRIKRGDIGFNLDKLQKRWSFIKKLYPQEGLTIRNDYKILDSYFAQVEQPTTGAPLIKADEETHVSK